MNNETKSALMAFMDGELGILSARRRGGSHVPNPDRYPASCVKPTFFSAARTISERPYPFGTGRSGDSARDP